MVHCCIGRPTIETFLYKSYTVGVLCVTHDPVYHNTYFILGKERNFGKCNRSHKWCSFEGSPEHKESDGAAAAREFIEESLGVVQVSNGIEASIIDRNYVCRIVNIAHNKFKRVYYVFEVPWQPQVSYRFHETREKLISKQEVPFELRSLIDMTNVQHYTEKCSVKLWSIDAIQFVLSRKRRSKEHFRSSFIPIIRAAIRLYRNQQLSN